jgi:hypothetical protein
MLIDKSYAVDLFLKEGERRYISARRLFNALKEITDRLADGGEPQAKKASA